MVGGIRRFVDRKGYMQEEVDCKEVELIMRERMYSFLRFFLYGGDVYARVACRSVYVLISRNICLLVEVVFLVHFLGVKIENHISFNSRLVEFSIEAIEAS